MSTYSNPFYQYGDLADSESKSPIRSQPDPIRVWLVDDDEQIRTILARLFRSRGIDCPRHFASAEAALGALDSEVIPDAILLDIHLGDKNGIDAIRPFKARTPRMAVIMLTTFFDSISRDQALRAGASGFLLKTYPMDKIAHGVYQACGRGASNTAARAA